MPGFHHPAKNGHSHEEVTEMFRRHWDIYRKVLIDDYMSHKAAYAVLHKILNKEMARPFAFADLACGDAYASSRCLSDTNVAEYTGIDLSEWALELAGKELGRLTCRHRLITGNFEEFDQYLDSPPDVVWVGLSVHHLPPDEKAAFIAKVKKSLPEGGMFLIYEPTLDPGEDRSTYYVRFSEVATRIWTGMTKEELETIIDHVKKSDIPELPADWEAFGAQAGFKSVEAAYTDPTNLYTLFKYE